MKFGSNTHHEGINSLLLKGAVNSIMPNTMVGVKNLGSLLEIQF
jgi:hypothetical protein